MPVVSLCSVASLDMIRELLSATFAGLPILSISSSVFRYVPLFGLYVLKEVCGDGITNYGMSRKTSLYELPRPTPVSCPASSSRSCQPAMYHLHLFSVNVRDGDYGPYMAFSNMAGRVPRQAPAPCSPSSISASAFLEGQAAKGNLATQERQISRYNFMSMSV